MTPGASDDYLMSPSPPDTIERLQTGHAQLSEAIRELSTIQLLNSLLMAEMARAGRLRAKVNHLQGLIDAWADADADDHGDGPTAFWDAEDALRAAATKEADRG